MLILEIEIHGNKFYIYVGCITFIQLRKLCSNVVYTTGLVEAHSILISPCRLEKHTSSFVVQLHKSSKVISRALCLENSI